MYSMEKIAAEIKKVARDLISEKRVDLVIGYEKGSLALRSRPCFVSSVEEVEKLVWNSLCTNNLSVYLSRYLQKGPQKRKEDVKPVRIGIVAKGCDVRSIVGLVKEKQISRENVVIIGVPCRGVIDRIKVETQLKGNEVNGYKEDSSGILHLTTAAGEQKTFSKEQFLADACLECELAEPEGVDIRISGTAKQNFPSRYERVREFEAKSPEERWQYFKKEISKCIRCNACRQACPNCFCKSCFAEQGKPRWVGAGSDLSNTMFYHIGRIFHQAGRCVECDACVRACPMGIDLRLFTQKMVKDVAEAFGYVAGLSAEEKPPLCEFGDEDGQGLITTL